jgi:hypothetical protein
MLSPWNWAAGGATGCVPCGGVAGASPRRTLYGQAVWPVCGPVRTALQEQLRELCDGSTCGGAAPVGACVSFPGVLAVGVGASAWGSVATGTVRRMTAVAIYTRLSHDRTGQQTATHRQQASCQAFAELRGWRVARVFEDVDLSAYRRGVVRPAYEEMLLAIQSKRIDGVVAWKLDRLLRRSAEFERLWETCEKNGVFLAS